MKKNNKNQFLQVQICGLTDVSESSLCFIALFLKPSTTVQQALQKVKEQRFSVLESDLYTLIPSYKVLAHSLILQLEYIFQDH